MINFSNPSKREKLDHEEFTKIFEITRNALIQQNKSLAEEKLNYLKKYSIQETDKLKYNYLRGLNSYLFFQFNEADQIFDDLLQNRELSNNLEEKDILRIKISCAQTKFRLGKHNDCLKSINEAELYIKKMTSTDSNQIMNLKNLIGAVYFSQGDLESARIEYQHSLELAEELNDNRGMAVVLNNLGNIYQNRGQFKKSLNHYQRSLQLKEEAELSTSAEVTRANIGDLFLQKGDIQTANQNLTQSLVNLRGNNPSYVSGILYSLILANSELDPIATQDYYIELQQLDQNHPLIRQQTTLAEATILKNSVNRAISRGKSQELFLKISTDKIYNFELTLYAKLNLCELLVQEYKMTPQLAILKELEEVISQIEELGKTVNSSVIKAEVMFLRANLALLNQDLITAKKLLNDAQIVAEQHFLQHLAFKISVSHDNILEHEEIILALQKEENISEIVKLTNFEDILSSFIKKQIGEIPKDLIEEPILFIILSNTGLSLYSHKFVEYEELNEHLIANFVSAINTFTTEAFSTSGSIERIKHEDFTLVIKLEDPIFFCYAFQGNTYLASKKIDSIIRSIKQNNKLWSDLIQLEDGLLQNNINLINSEVNLIFSS